jgi:hypothetical protein
MDDVLLEACKVGDLLLISDTLRAGADLHCYGDGPMFHAATNGHYSVVQHLWLHAPIPRVFHVGQGTLRKAAQRGYTDIVVFLANYATPPELQAAICAAQRSGQGATALALERFWTSKNDHSVCVPVVPDDKGED